MSVTFGNTAPNSVTTNLDSLFATSLANYRKTLIDNIGATNAVLYEIIKGESYESADGGTYFGEDLMYELSPSDSYSGYDELSSIPTDGITQAIYEWRQTATPIAYSMREVIQNKNRIVDLVKARIQQGEMGIKEGFSRALWWGNQPNGGLLTDPRVSPANGSLHVNPIPLIIPYNSTTLTVGGIPEATNTWWRVQTKTSAATTYSGFLYELEDMYNKVGLGVGGPCDLMLMDQTTYQLFIHAYFSVFKAHPDALDQGYPFIGKRFLNAKVIMDDKVPDVFTGVPGTVVGSRVDNSTMTFGSVYFINSKFLKLRYQPERNFDMLQDENGKTFAKPINGDSRVGHIAWMGQLTCNNRSKQGVLGKVPRTLTA